MKKYMVANPNWLMHEMEDVRFTNWFGWRFKRLWCWLFGHGNLVDTGRMRTGHILFRCERCGKVADILEFFDKGVDDG